MTANPESDRIGAVAEKMITLMETEFGPDADGVTDQMTALCSVLVSLCAACCCGAGEAQLDTLFALVKLKLDLGLASVKESPAWRAAQAVRTGALN